MLKYPLSLILFSLNASRTFPILTANVGTWTNSVHLRLWAGVLLFHENFCTNGLSKHYYTTCFSHATFSANCQSRLSLPGCYIHLFFTSLGFLCSYRGIYSIFPAMIFPPNIPLSEQRKLRYVNNKYVILRHLGDMCLFTSSLRASVPQNNLYTYLELIPPSPSPQYYALDCILFLFFRIYCNILIHNT